MLSGNANAGVNEPGFGPIASIDDVKSDYYENLAQVREKNKHLITYISINNNVYVSWSLYVKKIDEKSHEKAYKKCVKNAVKYNIQEDCFIFAIDDKIVWNLDGPVKPTKPKESESAESKAEQEKQAQLDKKTGRFFEDQPDVNDDYQIHFIYLVTLDGKDTELDISGWIEKRVNKVNDKFLKLSAKNKKSNGIGQQFKLDMTKEGKLDVTFVRMNVLKKQLNVPDYPSKMIYHYLKKKRV